MTPASRHQAPDPEASHERPGAPWPAVLARLGIRRNSPGVALVVLGTADVLLWVLAWFLAVLQSPPAPHHEGIIVFSVVLSVAVQLAAGIALGIYRHRDPVGSAPELRSMTFVAVVVLLALIAGAAVLRHPLLLSTTVIAWLIALVLTLALRQLIRRVVEGGRRPRDAEPVLVIGSGSLGTALAEQMVRDPASPYLPVGFLDDDPAKRRFRAAGVRVLGGTEDLAAALHRSGARGAVVAIGDAGPALLTRLSRQLAEHDAWLRTVPTMAELLESPADVSSIRDLDVTDLIGRSVSRPDPMLARSLIQGRRVLVTGAGGSIGSELCRQIRALDPSSLIMVDRDESALHALSMSLHGRALLDTPEFLLADIRDRDALDAAFAEHRPELVFHAAALKHLPVLERHPAEAWKTNVHGTGNVLETAIAHGVEHVVNISTDKAARPTSVLGLSKRVAEGLTTAAADATGRGYVSVRFGNVIGSRGSAIPLFAEQIRAGGPVTLTDPEATRYFMTIPEACELVLFAVAVGEPGETLVLDMGSPVRIADLVERMMLLSGRRVPVVHTGLRPGEKLAEELFTPGEQEILRTTGRVTHVRNAGIAPSALPPPHAPPSAVDAFYLRVLGTGERPTRPPSSSIPTPVPHSARKVDPS
ncbi:polysaccharide biosynthesis protein [Brachybacterium sp. AOP25-B2-12]|uniref:polysaccharide biosynthesis protein n=1 Tax=Brachybacterium sp. AOP25-B2-12 TaxID=3457710 RepID=UPI004033B41A